MRREQHRHEKERALHDDVGDVGEHRAGGDRRSEIHALQLQVAHLHRGATDARYGEVRERGREQRLDRAEKLEPHRDRAHQRDRVARLVAEGERHREQHPPPVAPAPSPTAPRGSGPGSTGRRRRARCRSPSATSGRESPEPGRARARPRVPRRSTWRRGVRSGVGCATAAQEDPCEAAENRENDQDDGVEEQGFPTGDVHRGSVSQGSLTRAYSAG